MEQLKKMSASTRSTIITYGMVIVLFAVMQALSSAKVISSSTTGLLVPITAYVCLSISLNLVVGISGELSLGHAGFMSVGAFTGIVVASMLADTITLGWARLLVSMLIGGMFAGLAGFLVGVPVMRLHGDYLAIVTLAFGEIIKNLLNNLYVGFDAKGLHLSMKSAQALGMEGGKIIINGPQGAVGISKLSTFLFGFLLVLFTLTVVLNLINSRTGRAIMAVRDNRIAAESVGINTTKYRLIAFVVSAALAGMAGVLYDLNFSSIVPKKFDFNTSILILVFVVLGGMGNIRGGIIAAIVLTILPEKLRFIGDFRMLMYAIVLISVMLVTNNKTFQTKLGMLRERIRRRKDPDLDLVASRAGGDGNE